MRATERKIRRRKTKNVPCRFVGKEIILLEGDDSSRGSPRWRCVRLGCERYVPPSVRPRLGQIREGQFTKRHGIWQCPDTRFYR